MFGKKCPDCGKKISRKFDFCPYCGNAMSSEDYGMLGKDDNAKPRANDPFEGIFNSSVFSKMMGGTIKMLERQLAKEMQGMKKIESEKSPRAQFELYVNGKRVDLGNNSPKIPQEIQNQARKIPAPSQELLEKSKKLPRKEAKTELRRFGNKITYEIKVPGIASLDRIVVSKLEDSFEVKAFADNCVYVKTIPVKLALLRYYLKEEVLSLEFQGK